MPLVRRCESRGVSLPCQSDRSVSHLRVVLFLVPSERGLSRFLVVFWLSCIEVVWSTTSLARATPLLGLAGVLGLGLAWVRLASTDSRLIVQTSLLVKLAAAAWLGWLALSGVSVIFAVFAAADLFAASLLILALVR